jgi:hypothetical protein
MLFPLFYAETTPYQCVINNFFLSMCYNVSQINHRDAKYKALIGRALLTASLILPPFLFICRWLVQFYTIQRQIKRNGGSTTEQGNEEWSDHYLDHDMLAHKPRYRHTHKICYLLATLLSLRASLVIQDLERIMRKKTLLLFKTE